MPHASKYKLLVSPEVFSTVIVNEKPVYTVHRLLMENEGVCACVFFCASLDIVK